MVNLNYAIFIRTPKNNYFFNKESGINPRHLQYLQFIGKLIGFSLLKFDFLVSPSLSLLIYKMMLRGQITIDDILQEFAEEASFVGSIKEMIDSIKSKEQFQQAAVQIPFTYVDKRLMPSWSRYKKVEIQKSSEDVIKGLQDEQQPASLPNSIHVLKLNEIIELKPGGSQIFVTFDTIQEYLDLFMKKIYENVIDSVKRQFEALMSGFKRVIKPKLISRFTAKQLKMLVQGDNIINIDDLKKHTRSNLDTKTSQLLWVTLEQLSNENRAIFLWNWTGVDKMAAQGAKIMNLSINRSSSPYFIGHTCARNLEVPSYSTIEEMKTAVKILLNNIKSGMAKIQD